MPLKVFISLEEKESILSSPLGEINLLNCSHIETIGRTTSKTKPWSVSWATDRSSNILLTCTISGHGSCYCAVYRVHEQVTFEKNSWTRLGFTLQQNDKDNKIWSPTTSGWRWTWNWSDNNVQDRPENTATTGIWKSFPITVGFISLKPELYKQLNLVQPLLLLCPGKWEWYFLMDAQSLLKSFDVHFIPNSYLLFIPRKFYSNQFFGLRNSGRLSNYQICCTYSLNTRNSYWGLSEQSNILNVTTWNNRF